MRSEDSVESFLRWRGEICISHLLLSCTFYQLWSWEVRRLTCSLVGPVFLRVFPVINFSRFLLQRLLRAEAVVLAVLNHLKKL